MPTTVLVVEDDVNILNLLSAYLESAGHKIVTATNGDHGLEAALATEFDICILDIMLPGRSGVELATDMRAAGCNSPILFLTALGNESEILRGFKAGADDYIVKPFSPRVLLVRIEAILRRLRIRQPQEPTAASNDAISIDENQPGCVVNGRKVELTPHEYRILRQLLKRPNRVFERGALIASIYGNEQAVSPKVIDVHVHHLRTKLGDEEGRMIQTVRGFGYKYTNTADNVK